MSEEDFLLLLIIATTQKHTIAVTISVKTNVTTTAITICMTLMEPHDSHSPEVTASNNALDSEKINKMITELITFRRISPKFVVIYIIIYSSFKSAGQEIDLVLNLLIALDNSLKPKLLPEAVKETGRLNVPIVPFLNSGLT